MFGGEYKAGSTTCIDLISWVLREAGDRALQIPDFWYWIVMVINETTLLVLSKLWFSLDVTKPKTRFALPLYEQGPPRWAPEGREVSH